MPIHVLHFLDASVRIWTLVGEVPFLIFIVALYLGGRRQGWPWRPALLATAAFVAGLGAGTAFLPSVLGATGGGIAAWFLAQWALGLRQPPFTVLALGLVALIAVGRWGCLLNGCCFGTITDLPWGVRYDSGSSAHFLHQSLGLLGEGAQRSLAVHPYPAYESLGLLLWLPLAYWLSRRLRSKGALLAFTAAFDLGLRGFIDGTRAMINVWWSLLGFWHGLNLFQWVLLASAASLLLLGVLCELRARTAAGRRTETSTVVATPYHRMWLVYLGLWALGWGSDSAQTTFVHRALLAAMAACVPALAIPRGLGVYLRARTWVGYAVAGALVMVLGIHTELGAGEVAPDGNPVAGRNSAQQRTWLYDVDQRRGVMVRVGSNSDDDGALIQREDTLDLPRLAARAKKLAFEESSPFRPPWLPPQAPGQTPPQQKAPSPPEAVRRSHTWVGGGFHVGYYSHSDTKTSSYTSSSSSTDSCSNSNTYTTTTTRERAAWGGWGQIEHEIPYKDGEFWIGGRAGASAESQRDTVDQSSTYASYSSYYLNLWGEYESPWLAVGLGGLGNYGQKLGTTLYPGFHLRGGSPRFSLDIGFADRMSFLSQQSGHAGFSFAIRRGELIRYSNDILARLFFGVFFFPGADIHRYNLAPGFGAEMFVTPRVALGLHTAVFIDQIFAGLHLRAVVGP